MAEKNEMLSKTNINWYPGHMAKAKREIKEKLKIVDIVIELLDARIPLSSRNPDINEIAGKKKRIIVLNKCDLADQNVNNIWKNYFKTKEIETILINSVSGKGIQDLENAMREQMKETIENEIKKGRIGRTIKCAIVGIPNVGKSSLINKMSGRNIVIAEDRPGVTKQNQWIRLAKGIELLDTPGVLWPKFEEKVGIRLALTGAIKEEVLDTYELAFQLMKLLRKNYETNIIERYKIENISELDNIQLIDEIGRKRGCLMAGGKIDTQRVSKMIIDEFQSGKLGQISLEKA